jgi:hypothetical protein
VTVDAWGEGDAAPFPGMPRHHVVDSIRFVSTGTGTNRMKVMMSAAEWATHLGYPGYTVVQVTLDHTGQLSMVIEPDPGFDG